MLIIEFTIPPPICGNLTISNRCASIPGESNLSKRSASATPGASISVNRPPRVISGRSTSSNISSSSSSRYDGNCPSYPSLSLHDRCRGFGGIPRVGMTVEVLGILRLLGPGLLCRREAILAGLLAGVVLASLTFLTKGDEPQLTDFLVNCILRIYNSLFQRMSRYLVIY